MSYYNELYSDDILIQCGYTLTEPGGYCVICGEFIDSDDLFTSANIIISNPEPPDFFCRYCASEEISEHTAAFEAEELNAEITNTSFREDFPLDLNKLIETWEYLEEKYRHVTKVFFVNPDLMNYFVQGQGPILTGIPVYQSEKVPIKNPIGFENWTAAYEYAKEHELFNDVTIDILRIKAEDHG